MPDDDLVATLLARLDRLEQLAAAAEEPVQLVGTMPPHVNAGELITSAWGNAVVTYLETIDPLIFFAKGYLGTIAAVTVGPGGAAQSASIPSLPAGFYLVSYSVLVASAAVVKGQLRLYGPTGPIFMTQFNSGTANGQTWTMNTYVDFASPSALNIQIENTGTANLDSFNDASMHRLVAVALTH